MAKTNTKTPTTPLYTANGAGIAQRASAVQQLRRLTLANLLFEDNFYIDGKAHADALREAVAAVKPQEALEVAEEARGLFNIRHAPLFIVREMARIPSHKPFVADALYTVIQRPDELSEFLAMYWKADAQTKNPVRARAASKTLKPGKTRRAPLSAQVKKGLARALGKFSEFQLSKYANREGDVTLRDVLFLTHAKPNSAAQAEVFRKLAAGELKNTRTWEAKLSAGADKKQTFSELMAKNELGGMAFVMNLRNMRESGIPKSEVLAYANTANFSRVLPFRFIAAAQEVPQWEDVAEAAMLRATQQQPRFPGKTVGILDISGSMRSALSSKSKMTRMDAGIALMMLLQAMGDDVTLYATAGSDGLRRHSTEQVRPRRGFALRDEFVQMYPRLGGGGIFLTQVMDYVARAEKSADRVVVVTDEQDTSGRLYRPSEANAFGANNYIINIAAEKNGIGYDKFTKIDGFSDAALKYIAALEGLYQPQTRAASNRV